MSSCLPNGYEMVSTFWQDFTIADYFGTEAVIDTYKRAFKEWKKNYVYLTELSIVMNWKMWQHKDIPDFYKVYEELWNKVEDYAMEHLKDDELRFYYRVTD